MKLMKLYIIGGGAVLVILLLVVALFVPIGSYTTNKSTCSVEPQTVRLDMTKGESLEAVRVGDVSLPPNAGCAVPTKYVLYAL